MFKSVSEISRISFLSALGFGTRSLQELSWVSAQGLYSKSRNILVRDCKYDLCSNSLQKISWQDLLSRSMRNLFAKDLHDKISVQNLLDRISTVS